MDADCVDTEKARLPQPRASFASRRRPSRSGRRRIAVTRGVSGYFFLGETAFLPMHDLPEETARRDGRWHEHGCPTACTMDAPVVVHEIRQSVEGAGVEPTA